MSRTGDGTRRSEKASRARVPGGQAEGIARPSSVRPLPDDSSRSSRTGSTVGDTAGDRTGSGTVPGVEVASVKRYRVIFERDESGAWLASVPSVPGCHSYGRSLVEARRRIREALGLWIDDLDTAELTDDIRIQREALAAVRRSRTARDRVARARDAAGLASVDAARRLVDELGLGVRDAAYLLGLSHQRVQQLLRSP